MSIFLLSTIAFAAKPPVKVQKAFEAKFATATGIKWAKENSKEWEAEFTVDTVKMSANFSNDGSWVETETQISASQLPDAATATIKKRHPTGEIVGAYKIDSAKNGIKYEADVKIGKKTVEVFVKEDGSQ